VTPNHQLTDVDTNFLCRLRSCSRRRRHREHLNKRELPLTFTLTANTYKSPGRRSCEDFLYYFKFVTIE
jgi:hypothetical protein